MLFIGVVLGVEMLMRGQPNPLCPLFTERESGDISRIFPAMLHWASAFNVVQLHASIILE